ncbi:TPA: peptidylprolyl isomerase [Vibrio parahaemolyticus]|uniref:peptidylprolyl isomerase n=1 Tax=Vibrio parahaemolyticus TaxID=670 RepID=UPI0024054E30|nr:peptidylprolyl isomerase [Vibrio parahaemolyticus]
MLASLQSGGELPADRLNKLSVSSDWELTSVQVINNSFGSDFSETLAQVPIGEWAGAVRSGLGFHLVRVRENEPAHLAPFGEIKEYVAQQYEYYAVLEAQKEIYKELLDRYQVQITANNVPEQVMQEYTQP